MTRESTEWSEDELQRFFKYLCRHLVAVVLAYKCRGDDGELEKETHFACLTAFVISVGQHWYLVTAGHIIDGWRPATRKDRPVQIVATALADYFGIDATRTDPLRFNLFSLPTHHAWNQREDIDFAVMLIDEPLQTSLKQNGILPLPINEARQDYEDFYGFGLVGFPEEYCGPEPSGDPTCRTAGVEPVLVPIRRDIRLSKSTRDAAFVADVVTMGTQKSVEGMSGGPVFGYLQGKDGWSQYEVVAIQSQWNGIDKRIIACPVVVALERVRASIRAQQDEGLD
ncbi:MAG TPA: hypothetical protein PKC18_09580 [Lacipirellulaceae bacterium]|nr:hypothetical protein [Lacipirellulaceae bacterium]